MVDNNIKTTYLHNMMTVVEAAVEKYVAEIPDSERRVCVIGEIKSINEDSAEATLSDDTGKIILVFTSMDAMQKIGAGYRVRVLGKVYITENGKIIKVEHVQNADNLDMDMYKKIRSLEDKYQVTL